MQAGNIDRHGNTISVQGALSTKNLHVLLASMHQAVENAGYDELVLDFSKCTSAFPGVMLATCAQVMNLRHVSIHTELKSPESAKLRKLFQNTNWAHLIDPRRFDPSTFRGYTQVPATKFVDSEGQQAAVTRIIDAILSAVPEICRSDFAAFEWAINELTDNVLTHSDSSMGGLVQVSTFARHERRVEFAVADAGVGIPGSLRSARPEFTSDTEALDKAIREGITRDKSLGQGNGLYGSWKICSHCNGKFEVESGHARLRDERRSGLHVYEERVPYDGTLIAAAISFEDPNLLQEALKFGGRPYDPVDYIETHYERDDDSNMVFRLRDEARSLGSRSAGAAVRNKLENIVSMAPNSSVYVDFDGIAIVSSSFADEVFAKLFVQWGAMKFMQKLSFVNLSPMIRQIIDRAISQRSGVQ